MWRDLSRGETRLACRDFGGDGPPVLLLHGLAGHAEEWTQTASWLTARCHVVALDGRGHGRSTRRPTDVSRDAGVADAAFVIERLGLQPAVVVGQSLGGLTALSLAARHPGVVRGLVLVDASPEGGGEQVEDTVSATGAALGAWPVPFASRPDAEAFFAARFGARAAEAWTSGLESREGGWWPRFDVDVMVRTLREAMAEPSWDEWERIACPALVVRAGNGTVEPETAERMARRPGVRVVTLHDAAHDLHLDRPEAWREALTGFLDDLGCIPPARAIRERCRTLMTPPPAQRTFAPAADTAACARAAGPASPRAGRGRRSDSAASALRAAVRRRIYPPPVPVRRPHVRGDRRPVDLAASAVGVVFAGVAALRRARALHPHGRAYRARVVIDGAPGAPAASLLRRPGEYPAEVRFSRGLGLPRRWPDLLGVGLRIHGPGGPQDVLVTSCGRRPRLRRIFLPATDFQQRPYSSALPYAADGERFVLYVVPDSASPRPGGEDDDLVRLGRAAASGALKFRLAAAAPGGPFQGLGTVNVGAPLPDDRGLRLNPYTGELRPVGLVNRLRRRAYPMSQAAWSSLAR